MAFSSIAHALGAPQHQQFYAPSLPQAPSVSDHASPMSFVNPPMVGRYDSTHATSIAHAQDLQDQSYQYHLQPSPQLHPVNEFLAEPHYQASVQPIAIPTTTSYPSYAGESLDLPSEHHAHPYMRQNDTLGDMVRECLHQAQMATSRRPNTELAVLFAAYLRDLKLRLGGRKRAGLGTPSRNVLSAELSLNDACGVEMQHHRAEVTDAVERSSLRLNHTLPSANAPTNVRRISPYLAAYHREKERRNAHAQCATTPPHCPHQRASNARESVAPINTKFGPSGDASQVFSSSFTAIELPYDTRNTCIDLDQSAIWPNRQIMATPSMRSANSVDEAFSSSHEQISTWGPPAWSDGKSGLSSPSLSLWTNTENSPLPLSNTISIPSLQSPPLSTRSTKKSKTSAIKPKQPKKRRVWGKGREYMRGYRAPPSESAKEAARKALEDKEVKKRKTAVKKVVMTAATHARKISRTGQRYHAPASSRRKFLCATDTLDDMK